MSGNSNILEDSYNYSDFKYSIDDVDDNLTLKWINLIMFQVVLVSNCEMVILLLECATNLHLMAYYSNLEGNHISVVFEFGM